MSTVFITFVIFYNFLSSLLCIMHKYLPNLFWLAGLFYGVPAFLQEKIPQRHSILCGIFLMSCFHPYYGPHAP